MATSLYSVQRNVFKRSAGSCLKRRCSQAFASRAGRSQGSAGRGHQRRVVTLWAQVASRGRAELRARQRLQLRPGSRGRAGAGGVPAGVRGLALRLGQRRSAGAGRSMLAAAESLLRLRPGRLLGCAPRAPREAARSPVASRRPWGLPRHSSGDAPSGSRLPGGSAPRGPGESGLGGRAPRQGARGAGARGWSTSAPLPAVLWFWRSPHRPPSLSPQGRFTGSPPSTRLPNSIRKSCCGPGDSKPWRTSRRGSRKCSDRCGGARGPSSPGSGRPRCHTCFPITPTTVRTSPMLPECGYCQVPARTLGRLTEGLLKRGESRQSRGRFHHRPHTLSQVSP